MSHAEAHLAVDLGAESGRVVLGGLESGMLSVREIHRFPNRPIINGNSMQWDVAGLWSEIRGVLSSTDLPEIAGIGVDAWGVDYALLGETGELLQKPFHYRDPRNLPAMQEVLQMVSKEEIYRETGVQFMPINTLYQLYAAQRATPDLLAAARSLIMLPDLFHYWLSGTAACEFTAASTTQFANPHTRSWSTGLLTRVGLPAHLPAKIVEPGTILGDLLPQLSKSQKNPTRVIAPASHDTASAVAAISAHGNTSFVSSGTWSLVGMELDTPVVSSQAMRMNFTNEGGVAGTTRLLKNVMGLWLLQCCRDIWNRQGLTFSYSELTQAAHLAPPFLHLFDPDDATFLNSQNMLDAVDRYCRRTHQPIPASPGAYARSILESLALKYRLVIADLELLIGHPVDQIHIIGGGSKNSLLNQFTADATGKRVRAGPAEASVLGNLGVQMLALGKISSLAEMRALIHCSFPTEIYQPREPALWDAQAARFRQYCHA